MFFSAIFFASLFGFTLNAIKIAFDAFANEKGRNPSDITINVYGQAPDARILGDLFNAGADRVIVRPDLKETELEVARELERIASEVL